MLCYVMLCTYVCVCVCIYIYIYIYIGALQPEVEEGSAQVLRLLLLMIMMISKLIMILLLLLLSLLLWEVDADGHQREGRRRDVRAVAQRLGGEGSRPLIQVVHTKGLIWVSLRSTQIRPFVNSLFSTHL